MGVSGQRHAPAELYPKGKDPRYLLDRRLGVPQSRSGHKLEEKFSCVCRGLNTDRPVVHFEDRHYID
jgi:hypothetical protein